VHEPQDDALSSAHSKVASRSFEEKRKVAVVAGVEAGGPERIVVSGATGGPVAITNGDRLSTCPQM
jgi:hypothetical protein